MPHNLERSMKKILKLAFAAAICITTVSPAIAAGGGGHGGGGAASNPAFQKAAAAAAKQACADNTIKCIGFGKKYYGQ